jgi:hypothetical protein
MAKINEFYFKFVKYLLLALYIISLIGCVIGLILAIYLVNSVNDDKIENESYYGYRYYEKQNLSEL